MNRVASLLSASSAIIRMIKIIKSGGLIMDILVSPVSAQENDVQAETFCTTFDICIIDF